MKNVINRAWRAKMQVLVWLLIISLIVPMLPPPRAAAAGLPIQPTTVTTTAIPFRDVSPTDWFYGAVVKMQEKGIFSGTDANNFSPKGTMTRAMYVTALGRMAGVDVSAYTTSSFADVSANSWYAPYIAWAVAQGITDGTGSGSFSPNGTVSREQMATMTLRYFESYGIPYRTTSPVTTQPGDLTSVSPWAADAVLKLWQAGIFSGDPNGNFNPKAQASRAEAATLFMRNVEVVEAWKAQNPATPTPTPTPTPSPTPTPTTGGNSSNNGGETGGGNGNGNENGNGSTPGAGSNAYTLTFESNGGSAIAAQSVQPNQVLTNLPAPTKDGFIFQGWFTDRELTLIFASGSTISNNTTLYAKYTDSIDTAVQSVPSYSVLDVASNYTITVEDTTGNLTAAEVKAAMTFVDTAKSDLAGITVTGGSGEFTVASAAEDGNFVEGNTYQLTLTSDNLTFVGQDATTDIYVFSVAKQEVMEIPLNPNMLYLSFKDITNMVLNGADVDAPAIPVVVTSVGDNGNSLADANAASGTFEYNAQNSSENIKLQVGDTVAIYTGIRPDQRTVETDRVNSGDVAYVQITAVDGDIYSYSRAEADQVLFRPDVLPVSVTADEDEDPANHSITIQHTAMNYSDTVYAEFGLDELTTVDVGDFMAFYEGTFATEGSEVVSYGRITSIVPDAERDIITYTDATIEDIENSFNIYQEQEIDGEDLLTEEQMNQLEDQIEQQARNSGFMDQAAGYLSDVAKETEAFKAQTFLAGGDSRVSLENLTVVASVGTTLRNISGRSSGISATLQVSADIVVDADDEHNLVIHMTGSFVQEIGLDLGINGDMQGHWLEKWGIPYWYSVDDYVITANLDAYSYTGINITAEMAIVKIDKLEAALDDWADAKTSGALGQVRDIATEIKAIMNGVQGTKAPSPENLKKQYAEMLDRDTEWVTLIEKPLFEKSVRVAYGLVEVKFEAEFVVKAQVNLSIGLDFYYKSAKRYSVSLRILSFSGSSNTVSLPGDGDYQFTFYVMGTLGLRVGIHMEVKAGLGSVDLNSIGISVEPGAYVNLWGYFYYQLKNENRVKTTRSLGALYVEIGIYLEVELGAQLGDGALSAEASLVDEEWPLYTIGEPGNVYDFAYQQDKNLLLSMAGIAKSIEVPSSLFTMSIFDLTDGELTNEVYDTSRFDIRVDNANFRYNPDTRRIEALNTSGLVSKGNLVITWKGAPLSFTSSPIQRTIPLSWRATENEYILQLDPRNGGVTPISPIVYNTAVKVPNPVYPGYTFNGWFTAPSGGEKITIPSRMPKEDYELYAQWTANPNTPYMVQHYLIDPNTRKPVSSTPNYTEMRTGTTDTEIRIDSDRFKSQGYTNGVSNGHTIRGDESTVIKIEYYSARQTAVFNLGYPNAPQSTIIEPIGRIITGQIPVPTRKGYTFAGWSPEAPSTMPASSTEYTALWTAKADTPYQVVYLKQDMASNTYTVADTESYRGATGAEANLDSIEPRTYEGFELDETISGTVRSSPIASNGKTVLKLYYKRNVNTLTINYNGSGQTTKVVDVPFGATLQLYLGTPEWEGHAFTGWSSLESLPTTMAGEDISVTALWTTNAYTVSFDTNGGLEEVTSQSVEYGGLVNGSQIGELTKAGYVFGGWYNDIGLMTAYDFAMPVTGDLTLYAKWLVPYTVSFDSTGGSIVDPQIVNEGSKAIAPLPAPTLDGYVFSGWYSDSTLENGYNFNTVVTGDITLYAKWVVYVPTTYTVSFNSNGGSAIEDQIVNEGVSATMPPNAPTLDRYTFEGWYSDMDLTIPYSFTEGVTADLALYAKWTLNSYTVTFNSNGGSAVTNQSVDDGSAATEPEAPSRTGYRFDGWYTSPLLTSESVYNFATPVTSSRTLYAKWTAMYTVTFSSDGGTLVDPKVVANNGQAVAPADPTKEGFIFNFWYTDANPNQAYDFATSVTTNLTLHASWRSNQHTVSFDSGEGSEVENQMVSPSGRATMPTAPTWEGYKFEGWYNDSAYTTVYDFNTEVTADLTLYAKWTVASWYNLRESFDTWSSYQILADSRGTTYIAYPNGSLQLDKYERGTWTNILQMGGNLAKFALDNQDVVYMTYSDGSSIFVQKYNGETWEHVGRDGSLAGSKPNLEFDGNNILYVVYNDPSGYMQVAKYVENNWSPVTGGSSLGKDARNPSIKFDQNNTPYVSSDQTVSEGSSTYVRRLKIIVSKYIDGAWVNLGDLGIVDTKSLNQLAQLDVSSDGVPYILHSTPSSVALKKFNGTEWQQVGENQPIANYTSLNLSLDEYDVPYIAYEANGGASPQTGIATVAKYEGAWIKIGEEDRLESASMTLNFVVGKDGNLYEIFKRSIPKRSNGLQESYTYDEKMLVRKHKIR